MQFSSLATQRLLAQSELMTHSCPGEHPGHVGPPQSMSDSEPIFVLSSQAGGGMAKPPLPDPPVLVLVPPLPGAPPLDEPPNAPPVPGVPAAPPPLGAPEPPSAPASFVSVRPVASSTVAQAIASAPMPKKTNSPVIFMSPAWRAS
jgi:hypothetical protein